MISLLITIIVIMIVIGLLFWAVTLLGGLGIPPQIIIALEILVILVGIVALLQLSGALPALR